MKDNPFPLQAPSSQLQTILLTKCTLKCILVSGGEDMTKSITLKELRPRLPRVIEEVDSKMDRFIITKRGKPAALMMSIDDYESILETIAILSDSKLMKKIKKAKQEIRNGNLQSLDEVEKELGIV